jgi:gamma-glutamylcyclotransferase (GGCT)/AIG2-like uncharacterized protein YtfP
MKKIFVYGILQKEQSAKQFGMKDEYYLGRATLPGYKREYLTRISKSNNGDSVEGDIYEVPDELEEKLYRFEAGFGYWREKTKPIRKEDGKEFETISYII